MRYHWIAYYLDHLPIRDQHDVSLTLERLETGVLRLNGYIKKALIVIPIVLFVVINTYLFVLNESLFASEKPYEVSTVEKRDLKETIKSTGVVIPKQIEEFYYDDQRGTLEEILVQEGDKVSSSTEILKYSSSDYESQINVLENEIDILETEQDYHEDRERLLGNQIVRESNKEDEEKDESTIFLLEQEQADAEYQADRIDTTISNKEDAINQLKTRSGETSVKSSISGTVTKVSYERGKNNEPVVIIANEDEVLVRTTLSEEQVLLLSEGDAVLLKSADRKERKGLVASIQPSEKENSKFQVDIEVEETDENRLQVGTTVEMTVRPVAIENAVAINKQSILAINGKEYVLVVKEGYIDKRKASFGFESGSYVEVTKGLKAKETIVKHPNRLLVDDMEIEVKNLEKEKKKEEKDLNKDEESSDGK
ncbi:efflux RND transporter periplasmic adaptor subunit [Pseudalkalibacillus berkeleyi]|uniref:Efflux RND transporter periplasmic adaptor subunit n=1 Tax=Pseudalkalibacillus berkeleyi TaxID=1069813 RepID=A0ABS9GYU8_9BACL|nr:HlyD family efflux transporter periplasmic adaptor subunit [Pseudalkalibacillus berkeleyi]MCF6136775.1 efflux RND transporter periplasmic adaptor subunit [Pseudalkalibacillus berkeleyi]